MQRVTVSGGILKLTITTADAQPAVAPFKISNKPGYDKATIQIDLSVTGAIIGGVTYYRSVRVVPSTQRKSDYYPISVRRGLVCGLDRCGPDARSLKTEGPFTITDDVTYPELGEPSDGLFPEYIHILTDRGWM